MARSISDRERLISYSYRATNDQLKEAIELFSAALRAREPKKDRKPKPRTPDKPKPTDIDQSKGRGE